MNFVSTVTTKGQVVIPHKIRKLLNIRPQQKVVFSLDEDSQKVTVEATEDIVDLAGTFVPPKGKVIPADTIRDQLEQTPYERF